MAKSTGVHRCLHKISRQSSQQLLRHFGLAQSGGMANQHCHPKSNPTGTAKIKFVMLHQFKKCKNCRLRSRSKRGICFAVNTLPLCLAQKWGPQFSNNLEDLYPASWPQTSFLAGLNLAPVPSGGWSRWRWRGLWPVLVGQTGEHHDQSPGPHNSTDDDIPVPEHTHTHTHTPLKMRLPRVDGYNLRHTMLQPRGWKQQL